MIWKIVYSKRGGHYHCALFSAPRPGHTFAKSGNLVIREEEWVDWINNTGWMEYEERR